MSDTRKGKVVGPTNELEWNLMARFLLDYRRLRPSADLKMMAWICQDRIEMVLGLNSWLGSTCQAHVAALPSLKFCPRIMFLEAFRYIFFTAQRKMVISVNNSKNERAMRMDTHIGFVELSRIPGMHDDGGDIVTMGMRRDQCNFIDADGNWRRMSA